MENEILKSILDTAIDTNKKVDRIEDNLTKLEARQEAHENQLEYLNKLVWRGNGKPALTSRVESYTEAIAILKTDIASIESRLESRKEMMWVLTITLIGAIAGGIWGASK